MPAKNLYHDAVRDALVADGWTITADPHKLLVGGRRLFVDLAGDRATLAADRGGERIAVEVQSFVSTSKIDDFHRAIGQYVVYRAVLRDQEPARTLYLAVTQIVYNGILSEPLGRLVAADVTLRVIVFHPTQRRIVRWIN